MRLCRAVGSTERFSDDPFGNVVNLSNKSFTKPQYKLLGFNLNFVPTPNKINKLELNKDIKQFGRRIRLRDHFGLSPNNDRPHFRSQSTWEPTNSHHTVQTFLEDFSRRVNRELDRDLTKQRASRTNTSNNLKKEELEALESFKAMDDIVITKADKGGAVVVQNVENYIAEAERQLRDKSFYKKVVANPTGEHEALICNAIDNLKQK